MPFPFIAALGAAIATPTVLAAILVFFGLFIQNKWIS